ncbi:hypothetical protein DPMN_083085 [Dreissena polymorpha]|uniref:Uncharacterized protein n=1 Tax=Dreissena polymorpha TaxID=45954 RepID=A0A9D3YBZ5_DREPO|nr:hypothetical protein DPMN_083085 [Dreissena polymorpha]
MCFRTVKEAHGQPWDKNDSRTLDGSYTDHHGSSRILPSSRINSAVLNIPELPCWPQGAIRTLQDLH